MEKLAYAELEKEVIDLIGKQRNMVLATCSDHRVTARTMSVVSDGLLIYFQTGRESVKYGQIRENPNVALCACHMQIEGTAVEKGHPLAPENHFFAEAYQKAHPGSYRTYSHIDRSVLIEVHPRLITLWKYDPEGKPYRDFLNIAERSACREMYPLE